MKKQWFTSLSALALALSVSSFSSAYAATSQNKAEIVVNGQILSTSTPTLIRNHTTWMPLDKMIQALNTLGTNAEFDGQTLLINNLTLQSSTLGIHRKGTINIACGAYAAFNIPVVKVTSGSRIQTYIPIWYVMQAIKQGIPGMLASWTSDVLNLTNQAPGKPNNQEISRVMQSVIEVKAPSEHFVLSGKPVTVPLANGNTLTAAIGTRYPTADGYGQVVFFFHNHQFIGLDSDVEKTEIRSLEPSTSGSPGFDITYANYKPSDPLYKPSLPPVTVHFSWNGSTVALVGAQAIPSGTENGIHVQKRETNHASSTTRFSAIPDFVKTAIQHELPTGATLVNRPGLTSPYLAVDLSGNGQYAYAAVYRKESSTGARTEIGTGLIVGTFKDGKWQTLWNQSLPGIHLNELNAADMTGDGEEDIAVQTYIGDGANDVLLLKLLNGQLKPVLDVYGTADIGDFNGDGQQDVAVWTHDTGPLENIQLYAWDSEKEAFEKAKNADFPRYFAGAPLSYDNIIARQTDTSPYANPPKMVDYAFASTYEWAGRYKLAAAKSNDALKQGKAAYPSDQTIRVILNNSTSELNQLKTYQDLPTPVKKTIDSTIMKYRSNMSPLSNIQPLVQADRGSGYDVQVIGTFHTLKNGKRLWATELNFTVDQNSLSVHNLIAKDSMGDSVWQVK